MTPREPDRFDKQARVLMDSECVHDREDYDGIPCVLCLADFLREAESSTLERAAQVCDHTPSVGTPPGVLAKRIRALIPPAAAPAACTCRYLSGTRFENPGNCPVHPDAPAAETRRSQGAKAYRIENLQASLAAAGERIAELETALCRWEALHEGHSIDCEEAAHHRECVCGEARK